MSDAGAALAAELAEAAQGARDLPAFSQRVVERLQQVVGLDSAIWMSLDGKRRPLGHINKGPFLQLARRYADDPQIYDPGLARGRVIAARTGGSYIDSEVYTAQERRELPFFVEIVKPQGITSQVVSLVTFRGRALGSVHLCRHGPGRRFGARELDLMRQVLPTLALGHAALRSPASPTAGAQEPLGTLTRREREIVKLVAQGLRNREVAGLVGSSPHTVRNQLHRVFEKLGISGRTELALWYQGRRR